MKKLGIILIITIAFFLRLYRLDFPLADWHSWRQADTASVTRHYVKNGVNLLHPRYDDFSDVASGRDNPEGYRFVEFPLYNSLHALLGKAFPQIPLEVSGRIISIFFSFVSLIFLFLLVKKYLGTQVAYWAAFFWAALPFNIYYSRVIIPEPMMIAFGLGALYFYDCWLEKNNGSILFCALFLALSLLIKPFSIFLFLPVIYLSFKKWHFNWRKWGVLVVGLLLIFVPLLWWRIWMKNFPEGIPQSGWLFNEAGIRFKGAFFYWIFAERIAKLILGYWGVLLFGLGLITARSKKEGWFFYYWLLGAGLYLFILASGNVRHDYYQTLIIPVICLFLAKGANWLYYKNKLLLLVTLAFMWSFSWFQIRDYFNINNWKMIKAGQRADQILPKEAKVIAPYAGDTAFLYQTNRRGWPIGINIEKFIKAGAQYYVNFNFDPETDWLEGTYCVVEKTADWVIIDLTKTCPKSR